MASYNQVVLVGNLTRDPELRYTPDGKAVANLGMAMNSKWRDQNQELKDEVTYVNVTAWGQTAEAASKYLKKGAPVLVGGRLRWHEWQTPTGDKRNKLDVVALTLQFLPRSSAGGLAAGEPRADATTADMDVDEDRDPFGELPNPLGLGPDRTGRRGDA